MAQLTAGLPFPSWIFYALVVAFFPVALTAQNAQPVVRRVTPKPVSARPAGLVSVSTAESGGLHDHAPLHSLPSFQVTKLDGTASGIASFQQPKHWLLLYRRENCAPCDRMLKTIAESDNALLKSGTQLVIVVADSGNTHNSNRLDATRAQFSAINGATWLEDTNGAAFKALKPRGTPMLYALSGDRIQWSFPGLPSDPNMLSRMAASWVNSEDPFTATPAGAKPATDSSSTASLASATATPAATTSSKQKARP